MSSARRAVASSAGSSAHSSRVAPSLGSTTTIGAPRRAASSTIWPVPPRPSAGLPSHTATRMSDWASVVRPAASKVAGSRSSSGAAESPASGKISVARARAASEANSSRDASSTNVCSVDRRRAGQNHVEGEAGFERGAGGDAVGALGERRDQRHDRRGFAEARLRLGADRGEARGRGGERRFERLAHRRDVEGARRAAPVFARRRRAREAMAGDAERQRQARLGRVMAHWATGSGAEDGDGRDAHHPKPFFTRQVRAIEFLLIVPVCRRLR